MSNISYGVASTEEGLVSSNSSVDQVDPFQVDTLRSSATSSSAAMSIVPSPARAA